MASSGDGEKGTSGGSSDGPTSNEVQEWEKRLMSGDLPEDFLNVTEPKTADGADAPAAAASEDGVPTGALLDLDPKAGSDTNHSAAAGAEPAADVSKEEAATRQMTLEERDHAMAMALQKQLNMENGDEAARAGAYAAAAAAAQGAAGGFQYLTQAPPPHNAVGRLTVTVAEAKLARNYGIARMDPYCRVRIGHCVYETPTCANGAREPKWNKTFNCYLLAGVKTMDVEIYDECTFQTDALIAHATISIPDEVTRKGEVVDEWLPLSGQEGHDKEGQLHVIMSLQRLQQQQAATATTGTIQVVAGQKIAIPVPSGEAGQEGDVKPPEPPRMSEEQMQEFSRMFPNLDKEVIASVFQENRGNQESTVNGLLLLSNS